MLVPKEGENNYFAGSDGMGRGRTELEMLHHGLGYGTWEVGAAMDKQLHQSVKKKVISKVTQFGYVELPDK